MKIYFAGSFSGVPVERLKEIGVVHKLYSYANEKKQATEWGKGLMLDSGAFSVMTKGITVDIDELIQYIKDTEPEVAIQLDVIGDDDKTWDNYLYMKKQVDVVPVIHYKASDKHIKRVVDSADYILLGALVPLSTQKKKMFAWLDYLYSNYNLQNKKIHLLGITNAKVLARYPVYSSDSSSALRINRYPSKDPIIVMQQKTKHYTDLYELGIKPILQMEKDITKLWESRGIKWN